MTYYAEYDSPAGKLLLTASDKALTGIFWAGQRAPEGKKERNSVLDRTALWLDSYFRGRPEKPDIPLAPEGTPFRQTVWKLLLEIGWGETKTYGEIAREAAGILGKERMSAQAVGQAVGANPISILIPCHRCVGAGGHLTGYAAGLEKKRWLLDHEQIPYRR